MPTENGFWVPSDRIVTAKRGRLGSEPGKHLPVWRTLPHLRRLRIDAMKEWGLRSRDGTRVLDTWAVHTSHDEEAPMGEQYVGIDLDRRRSVIVRMTGAGEVLETTRDHNDTFLGKSFQLAPAN
jgi:hypothetical protein